MDENAESNEQLTSKEDIPEDEALNMSVPPADQLGNLTLSENAPRTGDGELHAQTGAVYTLDGELAGDEFAQDAINYQILLEKIDALLDRLKLDA